MKDKHSLTMVRNQQEEVEQIKKDLVWVLILNGLLFAALIILFFVNRSTGQVDQFFSQTLKF